MNACNMRIVLTGATGGIGSELARALSERGADLLLVARKCEQLDLLRDELEASGRAINYVAADITTSEGRSAVAAAAEVLPGGPNVLINNAGMNDFAMFEDQSDTLVDRIVQVNAVAPMLLTHELLPALRDQRRAVVLNVGSIVGSIGVPGQVAYCSSKFALHGFSEALRRELRGSTVSVLYAAPRTTDTGMNNAAHRELNRRMHIATDSARAVADRIVRTLEEDKAERFFGWPERVFVKLNALFPTLVDGGLQKQTDLLTQSSISNPIPTPTQGVKQ